MTSAFAPNAAQLIANNAEYAQQSHDADLAVAPNRNLAVVACMDARIDPLPVLGLVNGEAHVIRNAGGVVTDDVIRSLCLSQRKLGTREVILLHHTDCGLHQLSQDEFNADLLTELGIKPSWSLESFDDPHLDVRQSIQRLRLTPFLPVKDHIRGFVYDVTTGLLDEVDPETA